MPGHLKNTFLITLSLLAATAFADTALAQETDDFSASSLVELPTENWLTNGGNLYNQRFSPLDQINTDNVANLKGVWRSRLNGSGMGPKYSGEAQPLVYEGVAYVITGADDVFALSIDTGEVLWQYTADLPQEMTTVCCGWTSRGVGMGEGKIFVGQLDGQLKALDQETGQELWAVQAEPWQEGHSITSAPLYIDGLVITGFAGGELGIRGRIKAFDADSGELVWTFYTIPGPGEFGHDTWSQENDLWMDGGASLWNTPAVDPELGLLYFSTGNAAANTSGFHRPGDNLFTASILALDIRTGEYRWHFQQVHHDIWDYDAPNPVMLFDIEIDGIERKGLAQAGKTGWFYILDRITGEPLIGIEERPVLQEPRQATAATQPYPIGDSFIPQSMRIAPEGYDLVNEGRIFTPYWTDPLPIAPGVGGGANWPPSAYDPRTGISYVCASDRPFIFQGQEISDERPAPGEPYTGGPLVGEAMYSFGVMAAMDMHTNTLVWQQHIKETCFSGMTATAGNLVFVGRNDGRLTALNSGTGKKLWEFQTGAGMNAPVTVFEHEGTQYVLAYSAGNVLAPSPHGDSVWLFSLNGVIEPVASAGQDSGAAAFVAAGSADLEEGRKVFESACLACHGIDGTGNHGGADLSATTDLDLVREVLLNGRNNMPAFGTLLKPEQLRDVSAYVTERIAR